MWREPMRCRNQFVGENENDSRSRCFRNCSSIRVEQPQQNLDSSLNCAEWGWSIIMNLSHA